MWKCWLNSYFLFILVFLGCFILSTSGENDVMRENKLTGTTAWWYPQSDIIPPIQGFTTRISYSIGNTVIFKVKTEPWIGIYSIAVFRLGYYNATGARLVANFTVKPNQQPPCNFEVSSRMTDCMNWQVSSQWEVPADAVSGVYVALPMLYNSSSVAAAYGSYIPFIVRQSLDHIGSDLLFKTGDLTWAAYNKYGSWNVYRGNGSFHPSSRASKYSYNRPWQNRLLPPEGQAINFIFGAEFAMIYWLEQHGFDVSYCSCADLENMYADNLLVPPAAQSNDTLSLPYKVLLSVGHDEYWTPSLRRAFEQAREQGVHLGFFSGNEAFWRVRWEQEGGIEGRTGSISSTSSSSRSSTSTNISNSISEYVHVQRTEAVIARRRHLRSRHAKSVGRTTTEYSTAEFIHPVPAADPGSTSNRDIAAGGNSQRIVVCRKETLDNASPATPGDWTGTFRDPRHRPAEEESRLTGQHFMVNAHRWDALSVTREDAALRFWRHTSFAPSHNGSGGVEQRSDQAGQGSQCTHANASRSHRTQHSHRGLHPDAAVYTSAEGVLGYEWDAFPQRARPAGLFPLSTTHKHVDHHLLLQYGAAYSGAGTATHRLSMYRHHWRATLIGERVNRPRDALMQQLCRSGGELDAQPPQQRSSLVFGAGTVQWSWALSDRHDGRQMVPDPDLQQATLNVFADMGVFPATLHSTGASDDPCVPQLVMPSSSTDLEAPTSKITSVDVRNVSAFAAAHWLREGLAFVQALRVRGTAEDRGGGQVAAVEVSVDGGRTWAMAMGRRTWHYSHYFVNSSHSASSNARPTDTAEGSLAESLHIEGILYGGNGQEVSRAASVLVLSRAVDDSGWLEQPSVAAGLCAAAAAGRGHPPSETERRAMRIAGTRIVHSNALLVQLQEL